MNALYSKAKEALLAAGLDLTASTIKAVPVDLGQYTPNLATDANLSDIPSGALSATAVALTTKTHALGVFDADDVTFAAVVLSKVVSAYVIYNDTGTASTSKLVCIIDTGTGLPLTASGADVIASWDNGANKIFKL